MDNYENGNSERNSISEWEKHTFVKKKKKKEIWNDHSLITFGLNFLAKFYIQDKHGWD